MLILKFQNLLNFNYNNSSISVISSKLNTKIYKK